MPQIETVEEFKRRLEEMTRDRLRFVDSRVLEETPTSEDENIDGLISGERKTLEWILRDVLQVSII